MKALRERGLICRGGAKIVAVAYPGGEGVVDLSFSFGLIDV